VDAAARSERESDRAKTGCASSRVGDVVLSVRGIELLGPHGVYPQEQEAGNRFTVDVEMRGLFAQAVESDELSDTVDYDAVVQRVCEVNRRRTFHLIESFAGAIADELLDRFDRVSEVRIQVRKLSVAKLGPNAWTMVELSRRRA
jgi:dihydroneopterin aldolase